MLKLFKFLNLPFFKKSVFKKIQYSRLSLLYFLIIYIVSFRTDVLTDKDINEII